jgi:sirohydrochlorin cobaltochelatase
VQTETFPDTTLVLIGHGSTVNAESSASVRQQAAALRLQGVFGEVREAFWKVEPFVPGVLAQAKGRRVVVVPFFVSEGWFTEEAIPEALGLKVPGTPDFPRRQVLDGREVCYCRPIGTHERMADVIQQRAREVVRRFPFPRAPREVEIGLLVGGHGTERNAASRRAVEDQAARIAALGIYREVCAVFMLEEPRIADFHAVVGARAVVVVPFFMSDGLHVTEDIPVLLGEPERVVKERLAQGRPTWRNPTERRGKLVWYAGSVGTEPALTEVIVERAREAMQG